VTLAQFIGTLRQELQLVTESLATSTLRGISPDTPANALVRPDRIALKIPLVLSVASAEGAKQKRSMAALGLEHLDLAGLNEAVDAVSGQVSEQEKAQAAINAPALRFRVEVRTLDESKATSSGNTAGQLEIEFVIGAKV
jgi:hypothetical protein